MNILIVGIAGFLGAAARYGVSLAALKYLPAGFPWATLTVNISGSLLMGFLTAFALQNVLPERMVLFAGIGFIGSFTTFSTFSMDTILLFRAGQYALCILNIALNPLLAISAAVLGLKIAS